MDPPKRISFQLGEKRKFTAELFELPRPAHDKSTSDQDNKGQNNDTVKEQFIKVSNPGVPTQKEAEVKDAEITDKATTPSSHSQLSNKRCSKTPSSHQILRPPSGPKMTTTEPPAKRAKRTDSSAMWEHNSSRTADRDYRYSAVKEMSNGRDRRDDRDRYRGRDDGRRRSRSRDRPEKRRDRSRSRERDSVKYRNGERGGERDRRDMERTASRERHRSRRDDPPPRRSDRHRTRSRSPPRNEKPPARTRSPPRGPSSKAVPSKPQPQNPTTKPPPSTSMPPTESRKPDRPNPERNTQTPMANIPPPTTNGTKPPPNDPTSTTAMDVDSDPETAQLRKMMGFATFKTTKNTKVPGNNVYAIRKEKKTEYRQYMNRVGGFNRPLSPSR